MTWRVLISAPYLLRVLEEYRPILEAEGVEIVTLPVHERLSEDELLSVIETIDGAICGDDRFSERVLRAGPRLKVISKWGTGIDSIDAAAAAKLHIEVCNTPDAFTDAVADTTVGYVLCFARQLPWMDREIRLGKWNKVDLISLKESTLGVIGMGNIGKAVVRRARAFGMKVLGTDPVSVSDSLVADTGLTMTSLPALLRESDYVTLHCDLNPSSFHLIGRDEFHTMRSSAYLINTSRGSVVDEPALIDALTNRQIAGAALDVFEVEPLPADSPLRTMDNCLLAAHNANSSPDAWRRVHESTINNLLRALSAE